MIDLVITQSLIIIYLVTNILINNLNLSKGEIEPVEVDRILYKLMKINLSSNIEHQV
jgi:hypothetical protein